jgi:hypothetical protein
VPILVIIRARSVREDRPLRRVIELESEVLCSAIHDLVPILVIIRARSVNNLIAEPRCCPKCYKRYRRQFRQRATTAAAAERKDARHEPRDHADTEEE